MKRTAFLGITVAAALALALPAAANAAPPTVALEQDCPSVFGQQLYGAQATFTGLPPGAVFNLAYDFGGLAGDAVAVASEADGTLTQRFASDQPVAFISVGLVALWPEDAIAPLTATLAVPCSAQR